VTIRAEHDAEGLLSVSVGEYRLTLNGGKGNRPHSRPSPVELLVASLAACMATSGRQYLRRAGFNEGLSVECGFEMSQAHPDHIASIGFTVTVPPGIPPGRREALTGVLNHCAHHDPLHLAPRVEVAVRDRRRSDSDTPSLVGGRYVSQD
jgi:uncharacterized OsmC-like protein